MEDSVGSHVAAHADFKRVGINIFNMICSTTAEFACHKQRSVKKR